MRQVITTNSEEQVRKGRTARRVLLWGLEKRNCDREEPNIGAKDDYDELKQASDSARTGKPTEDADEIKDDGLYDESSHLDSDHPDADENWMRSIRSGRSSPYRKLLLYKKYSSKLQKNRGALHSSSFVRIGKDNNESAVDDEAGDLGSKEGVATYGDDDDGTSSGEVSTNFDDIPVENSPDSAGSIDALDTNRGFVTDLWRAQWWGGGNQIYVAAPEGVWDRDTEEEQDAGSGRDGLIYIENISKMMKNNCSTPTLF